MRKFNVAVVGATGAVGEELLRVMDAYDFPVNNIIPLASAKSAGSTVEYKNKEYTVLELTETVFEENDVEIAFFSAGGSISAKFAKFAVEAGAVVIDNTSHFRMEPNIPLVVPEVNPDDISKWKETGIIANPNCSTIQMVLSLKPLDELYGIKRVDVSTYQAVSGAGKAGMEELVKQMQAFFAFKLDETKKEAFAHQIALNVIPQIDVAQSNGFTKEEMKMINETQKILHKQMQIAATCVRVPVLRSHSESITVTFDDDVEVDIDKVKEVLGNFDNVDVIDDLENNQYPMPIISTDTDTTFVGRIRKDAYANNIIHYFNVADQVRVGAATNSVRIALKWIEMENDI
ncbi:aspartate-semialdehyde dehydrogenase [Malaciobacter canalis]|jgi:aspartate-semialdehyde dehydrogenase|uniref:Aspartate-semialdehyde dehydrogenase n=2 Tax=Malaciobacter TaxID=2321114 RepID=A0AB36ZSH9_9BACT|nr:MULTISPECIES: aspartate-semialdehyde dehydrogenase [Malaciobacter]PHO09798.1 aspartate-semialdehyde dehydrogenase [Malaciobacter canalis]PPK58411.1 aspartate-semialdehyde dehydrogenase [Malaciobacter marinus]QEE33416.1 aspartate-semialdehyde dehydrogenase [Malaciobacter canalis]SKB71492.1 aspartate-semialdehyde dehydrogenase [Malaciobacter marinus]